MRERCASSARQAFPGGLLALVLLPSPGCGSDCIGVGCANEFGASRVGLHIDPDLSLSLASPREADQWLVGDRAEGIDWSVAVSAGGLLVGMPAAGEVRSFPFQGIDTVLAVEFGGRLQSDAPGDRFGETLLVVGDVDGDTVPEVAIGAPLRTVGTLVREAGVVLLVSVATVHQSDSPISNVRSRKLLGPQAGAHFGSAIATCPDMDGDGAAELLVGLPSYNADQNDDGRIDLPLAGAVAFVPSMSLPAEGESMTISTATLWTGAVTGERAGSSLACADLIGDSTPDIAIGAPYADGDHNAEGAVYIIDGASPRFGDLALLADVTLNGMVENDWLGWSLAAGDIDGDGQVDLAASAPGYASAAAARTEGPRGQVVVWSGDDLRSATVQAGTYRIQGRAAGDSIGRSIQIEDIDSDGYDDLFVGAPRRSIDEAFDAGALYLFRGNPNFDGWRPFSDPRTADNIWETARQYLETGGTFAIGDVDGSGTPDLVLVHRRQPG